MLKLERIKDYLLMEQEFIENHERLKPSSERQDVIFQKLNKIKKKTGRKK